VSGGRGEGKERVRLSWFVFVKLVRARGGKGGREGEAER